MACGAIGLLLLESKAAGWILIGAVAMAIFSIIGAIRGGRAADKALAQEVSDHRARRNQTNDVSAYDVSE